MTNLEYLRTALEVLESGEATEINRIKILRVMASICTQNAERLQRDFEGWVDADLVD